MFISLGQYKVGNFKVLKNACLWKLFVHAASGAGKQTNRVNKIVFNDSAEVFI